MIRNRATVLRIVPLTAFMLRACVLQSAYDQLQRKIGSCKRGSRSRGRSRNPSRLATCCSRKAASSPAMGDVEQFTVRTGIGSKRMRMKRTFACLKRATHASDQSHRIFGDR
jgi:hypothetical protein